jgi:glycosyltransferase involved in cell wall biosynthesis
VQQDRIRNGDRIRAVFLSGSNPRKIGSGQSASWSGTAFHMLNALEPHFDFVHVVEEALPRWFGPVGRGLRLLTAKKIDYVWLPPYVGLAARKTVARIAAAKPDLVFAVACSPLAYHLVKRFNVVHISDTTFHAMRGYYDGFTQMSSISAALGEHIERTVIRNAFLALYPTNWAWRSAIDDYGVSPDRAVEIAWGANIEEIASEPRHLPQELRFLFAGVDWGRKGGDIAIGVIEELTRRGIACRLDAIGCDKNLAKSYPLPNVTFHGFVDNEVRKQLYKEATFFIMPTKAECFGSVMSESASCGLPSLSYDTGGVSSVVLNGKTGILLPPGAPAAGFADAVCSLVAEPSRYAAMSAEALADARGRLRWDIWAARAAEEVRRLLLEKEGTTGSGGIVLDGVG